MSMHTILLIEDDSSLTQSLLQGLREDGYRMVHVSTVFDAQAQLSESLPDLILLDLGLPDGDGMELLSEIQAKDADLPVIILTARDGIVDRVSGLDGGAMDYMVKPFALAELKARLRLRLRNRRDGEALILQAGGLTVDLIRRRVRRGELALEWPPREFDLLVLLLRSRGQPVSRAHIARDVWNSPRRMSSLDNLIDVHVSRLRERLKELNTHLQVRTIRGVGYQIDEEEAE
ncbi:MAG: response regulator transcription factor [Kiritimatiellia bacterium]